MHRKFLRSKIHRATITQADVDYEGSLTLPPKLMRAADILSHEAVWVWNVTRGTRLETYAIEGVEGSRDICANGAAAHQIRPGDVVIIATFAYQTESDTAESPVEPRVVFVDAENEMIRTGHEVPGPRRRGVSSDC
ncbi:MAG: aspartate 1-decarboxylase [Planctomycetota bacterium]|nr:aspartate 1-decarboxylase [Planctomycetota bacterium]